MSDDFKWFIGLMVLCVIFPLVIMVADDWRKQSCRVDMVKAGRTVDEIKELCK